MALLACNKDDDEPKNDAPGIEAQTFSVAENAAMDAMVGTVAAEDAQDDELTFAITSGNLGDAFAINAGTGAITVAGTLDHETTAAYTLTVQVSDGTATAEAEITIDITDVNEAPMIDANQNRTFSVAENAANGTAVGTVSAEDEDKGDELTFSIANGNTNGNTGEAFQIDNTGALTVKTPAALDFETKQTFTLTVSVSDGELSVTTDITVNLTDVNDSVSVIAEQTFSVAENAANGTAVGTVVAMDDDGDNLTFAFTSGNLG
ncbi:MAG: cadherin repeat domain-containing protein, partial [Ekhidna sp.]|nr:cadherin repeat domain-containing protein [Ekhidna sp.]